MNPDCCTICQKFGNFINTESRRAHIQAASIRKDHVLERRLSHYPASNYLLKVNNRNTRTSCEICLTLNIFHTMF